MTQADFQTFETTLTKGEHVTSVVMAYTPYDRSFVASMRDLGARFVETNGRKGWWVRADGVKVERFRAACAKAQANTTVDGPAITAANLAYHMYDSRGALFG